jgi:hypothetical protein
MWYIGLEDISRKAARWVSVAWCLSATVEFWILGRFSFIGLFEDIDEAMVLAYVQRLGHGQFSHALTGGVDTAATTINIGAVLSLEGLLLGHLPLWLGIAIHKLLLMAVSFSGMYLLSRRAAGAGRLAAVAVAALFSLSQDRLVEMTVVHGLGFGVIPLAVYVCVGRLGKAGYWPGVVAVAVLNALSSSPTHSNLVLFASLAWSALLLGGWRRVWQVLPALILVALVLVANWGDSLLAKMQLGPWSARGDGFSIFERPWANLVDGFMALASTFPPIWVGLATGAALILRTGDIVGRRGFVIIPVSMVAGSFLQIFPWKSVGIDQLSGFHFTNFNYAVVPLAHLMMAIGLGSASKHSGSLSKSSPATLAVCTICGLAVGQLAWYKVQHGLTLLSLGGYGAAYASEGVLGQPTWLTAQPVRVVTIPYRLAVNTPILHGLDTMDGGGIHVPLRSLTHMWKHGVTRNSAGIDMVSGFVPMAVGQDAMKCSERIDIDKYFDTAFLRLSNVGFILSTVPLTGEGLTQVAGSTTSAPVRCSASHGERLRKYADYVFHPPEPRIYALDHPAPRVYAAQAVQLLDTDDEDPIERLQSRRGADQLALVRPGDGAGLVAGAQDAAVSRFALVEDGVDIDVSAPHGGLVVVNTGFLPFWTATSNGRPARVIPVNGFQMGVVVSPGATDIRLRYHRPTLKDKMFGNGDKRKA